VLNKIFGPKNTVFGSKNRFFGPKNCYFAPFRLLSIIEYSPRTSSPTSSSAVVHSNDFSIQAEEEPNNGDNIVILAEPNGVLEERQNSYGDEGTHPDNNSASQSNTNNSLEKSYESSSAVAAPGSCVSSQQSFGMSGLMSRMRVPAATAMARVSPRK